MFSSSSRLHWGNPPAAGQGVWLDAWMDKRIAKRPSGHWVGPVNLVSEPHHLPNKAAFVFIVYNWWDKALCKHGFWAYFLLISPVWIILVCSHQTFGCSASPAAPACSSSRQTQASHRAWGLGDESQGEEPGLRRRSLGAAKAGGGGVQVGQVGEGVQAWQVREKNGV